MNNSEFYIGWMPKAPGRFANHIKKVVLCLAAFVITISFVLALSQKKFGTGNFEFGSITEIKGILSKTPVPNLKIVSGKDIWGNPNYITAILVGYGKHGADGIINDLESENGTSLDKKEITLKGTLLYNDGKVIVQIAAQDKPLLHIGGSITSGNLAAHAKDLGNQNVKGEIIDPKCYFGVMKPGEGKPHRDCAIRCILGGIPPFMHVVNNKGQSNYYLIVGPNGEKMNEAVQSYVAEPIELKARLEQYDDWIVMYVQDKDSIHEISYLSMVKGTSAVMDCEESCSRK